VCVCVCVFLSVCVQNSQMLAAGVCVCVRMRVCVCLSVCVCKHLRNQLRNSQESANVSKNQQTSAVYSYSNWYTLVARRFCKISHAQTHTHTHIHIHAQTQTHMHTHTHTHTIPVQRATNLLINNVKILKSPLATKSEVWNDYSTDFWEILFTFVENLNLRN